MLRKMYLFTADRLHRVGRPLKLKKRKHHLHDWVKMRQKIGEDDIGHKTKTKAIADFLRLPNSGPGCHAATGVNAVPAAYKS